jgi:choloylglycine hydrolase
MKRILLTAITFISAIQIVPSLACTDFRLKAKDDTVLITRTMEFAIPMNSSLCSSPIDTSVENTAPDGKPGMLWKTKYGFVYLNGMGINHVIDGMNTEGLSVEALFLPGETTYQTVPAEKDAEAIPYYKLGDYLLGNFKTVDEVKAALSKIVVFQQNIPEKGDSVFPLHFIINDASGNSIVVEFVKGKMEIYDDTLGVATNSPTYDWQITNLRNYINLSPNLPNPHVFNGITYAATGQGSGMNGLPGDASPPSRFVKIASLIATSLTPNDAKAELILADHIINNVDIPYGFVRAVENGATQYDYTQWTDFKDLTHKIFYFRTYDNPSIRFVSLDKINFSKDAKPLQMPIDNNTLSYTTDVTESFTK